MRIFISLALIFFISPCAQSAELWKSEKPIANFHLKAKYQSNSDGTISISAAPGATVSFSVKQGSEGIIEIGASQKEMEIDGFGKVSDKEIGQLFKNLAAAAKDLKNLNNNGRKPDPCDFCGEGLKREKINESPNENPRVGM